MHQIHTPVYFDQDNRALLEEIANAEKKSLRDISKFEESKEA
jgi:hypothetical protein